MFRPVIPLLVLGLPISRAGASQPADSARLSYAYGAIVRMDTTTRTIYLVFTGHEFADGGELIRGILRKHAVKANFFFTGDFYRTERFGPIIRGLREDGHYLGAHSDKHLLYCDWSNRDSLLVTKEQFLRDLDGNYQAMAVFGIRRKDAPVFIPPYEWYNQSIADWCREAGITLVNFTPGTSSNADYTWPGLGRQYVSSDTIFQRILRFESTTARRLCGFILLLHIGTDPRRTDKFYPRLDELIEELKTRGYQFARLG